MNDTKLVTVCLLSTYTIAVVTSVKSCNYIIEKNAACRCVTGLIIAFLFQMPSDSISNCESSGRHGGNENELEGTRTIIIFTKTLAVIPNKSEGFWAFQKDIFLNMAENCFLFPDYIVGGNFKIIISVLPWSFRLHSLRSTRKRRQPREMKKCIHRTRSVPPNDKVSKQMIGLTKSTECKGD